MDRRCGQAEPAGSKNRTNSRSTSTIPKIPTASPTNPISAIREDRSGTLWFGTYGGGLNRFDRETGRFFAYRHEPKRPGSLSSDLVLSLLEDRQGMLWVGTQGGGLNRFDPVTGRFTVLAE